MVTSASPAPARLSAPSIRRGARAVLREPFRAATWRRVAYLLLALPVGVLCVPLALVGGPAGRVQRGLARRLLGLQIAEPAHTGPRALAHAVISLPLNLIAAVLTGYGWSTVPLNFGWPLRPLISLGDADPTHAWGGPTLAGVWGLHALGGLGFLLLMPWIGRGLTALQGRLAACLLGGRRTGVLTPVLLALLVVVVGAALALPVAHQI
ncbi:hypothetical protein OG785_19375 [Streptomyces sp. NBC_00006]|uniref:hypothetical protein n=1 Tax=Streptomyces sp. NBC_00006 TaxID=2975619 RepID=UPI00225807F8|nr:hypothetical protein [Streptomyces sp. NBC_00006]MCX5532710.1 hypothetical protein [Streptomyces sp. NBC_00006]